MNMLRELYLRAKVSRVRWQNQDRAAAIVQRMLMTDHEKQQARDWHSMIRAYIRHAYDPVKDNDVTIVRELRDTMPARGLDYNNNFRIATFSDMVNCYRELKRNYKKPDIPDGRNYWKDSKEDTERFPF